MADSCYEIAVGIEPHLDFGQNFKAVALKPVPQDDAVLDTLIENIKEDLDLLPDVLGDCIEIVFDAERSRRPGRELQAYVGKSLKRAGASQIRYVKREVVLRDEGSIFEHLENEGEAHNDRLAA